MTSREDRANIVQRILIEVVYQDVAISTTADRIVDALLPQITTVEQLEALPEGAVVSFDGLGYSMLLRVTRGELRNDTWRGTFEQAAAELATLTVVWQP